MFEKDRSSGINLYPDEYEDTFGDSVKPERRNNFMNKLKRHAEQAKINYSVQGHSCCSLDGIYQDDDTGDTINIEITKEFLL